MNRELSTFSIPATVRAAAKMLFVSLCGAFALLSPHSAFGMPDYQGSWYYTCPLDSIMGPVDVAVTSNGDVLVCQRVFRAERFTATGGCISHWTVSLNPTRLLAVDELPGGGTVVLDGEARKLHTFDVNGTPLATWGDFGDGVGRMIAPTSVRVSPSGQLFVPDYERGVVLVFSAAGVFLREWRTHTLPGEIAFDDSSQVYLASPTSGQMEVCSEDGTLLRRLSSQTPIASPQGLAFSPDGRLYVSDALTGTVTVMTRTGGFIERFGAYGSGPGEFNGVGRLACDQLGNLYVADEGNYRICKFGPGPSPSTRRSWGQLKVMHR